MCWSTRAWRKRRRLNRSAISRHHDRLGPNFAAVSRRILQSRRHGATNSGGDRSGTTRPLSGAPRHDRGTAPTATSRRLRHVHHRVRNRHEGGRRAEDCDHRRQPCCGRRLPGGCAGLPTPKSMWSRTKLIEIDPDEDATSTHRRAAAPIAAGVLAAITR